MNDKKRSGEIILSQTLRWGLLSALFVVVMGGALFLWQDGHQSYDFHIFHGEPYQLTHLYAVFSDSFHLQSLAIIQLGILLLIATPVARVFSCLLIFAWQRDFLYVGVASFVLAILFYSLWYA